VTTIILAVASMVGIFIVVCTVLVLAAIMMSGSISHSLDDRD